MNTCIRCNISKPHSDFRIYNTCIDCEKRYAKSVYMLDGLKKENLNIIRQQYFELDYIKIIIQKYCDVNGNYYWRVLRNDGRKYKMMIPLYNNLLTTINDIYYILVKHNAKAHNDILYIISKFKTDYQQAILDNAKL